VTLCDAHLFVWRKLQNSAYWYVIQSGVNISESVILTNSNNDTDLVWTIFFNVILIRYSGKFVFRLRHNKTGNQRCYFLHNQYPLHWHLVKHASLLRKLHRVIIYCTLFPHLTVRCDCPLVVMKSCDKDAASVFIQARVLSYCQITFINDRLQSVK